MSWLNQLLLAAFGLTAMAMALGRNDRARRWAPLVGLAGQPFWLDFALETHAWGLMVICAAYTGVYAWGAWKHWGGLR